VAFLVAILNILSFQFFDKNFESFISYQIPEISQNQIFLDEK
jgi:hypothetical protein